MPPLSRHRRSAALPLPVPAVGLALAAVLLLSLAPPVHLAAHEVPADVVVQALLKTEPGRLRLLVRVPLSAMRDVDVPTRGPGFVDLARADGPLRDAATLWLVQSIDLFEGGARLRAPQIAAVRVSLPSDSSFRTYDEALAHLTGAALPEDTELYWEQGLLDVLLDYPIESVRSDFSIAPRLSRLGLRVLVVLRFVTPDGAVRAFELAGDPGLVRLDPRWHQAALRFVRFGFSHILDGADHLLFLACLVIPIRRLRSLVLVVTSFTLAHSVTLAASAFGLAPGVLWFPPLVETLVAASIVYMGIENIVGASSVERRWAVAFGFGLVHGFGFSFALRDTLQFAGSHLLTSLVSFNVGVELGQLAVLAVLVPLTSVLLRRVVAERMGTIVLSAIVVHTGWHWMIDRGRALAQYRFEWPAFDLRLLATAAGWLTLAVAVAGLLWLLWPLLRRQEPDATAFDGRSPRRR